MAKKFVRGITDIKTISNQDFDTNNVNDLLSDGQNNYIHRKKQDGSEEYHNLTNNIKTIEAEDNGLLTVINYNNSSNKAKLTVHHDQAKSQLLGSPDLTINVQNGENGSAELTTVDINPTKVLTHENLKTAFGISKITNSNTTTLGIEHTEVENNYDLNNLINGNVTASIFTNAPTEDEPYYVQSFGDPQGDNVIQTAFVRVNSFSENALIYRRYKINNVWGVWRELLRNKDELSSILNDKQNKLTSNTSIGVAGNGLRQLYTLSQTYTHANGFLKTRVKSIANSASVSTAEEEFHFLAKMDKGSQSATFTLNEHDTVVFEYLIDTYGLNGTVNIHGSAFSLNGSTLTFLNNTGAQYNPHIITFSDIIPTSAINTTQSAPSRVEKTDEIVDKEQETE